MNAAIFLICIFALVEAEDVEILDIDDDSSRIFWYVEESGGDSNAIPPLTPPSPAPESSCDDIPSPSCGLTGVADSLYYWYWRTQGYVQRLEALCGSIGDRLDWDLDNPCAGDLNFLALWESSTRMRVAPGDAADACPDLGTARLTPTSAAASDVDQLQLRAAALEECEVWHLCLVLAVAGGIAVLVVMAVVRVICGRYRNRDST